MHECIFRDENIYNYHNYFYSHYKKIFTTRKEQMMRKFSLAFAFVFSTAFLYIISFSIYLHTFLRFICLSHSFVIFSFSLSNSCLLYMKPFVQLIWNSVLPERCSSLYHSIYSHWRHHRINFSWASMIIWLSLFSVPSKHQNIRTMDIVKNRMGNCVGTSENIYPIILSNFVYEILIPKTYYCYFPIYL